VSDHIGCLLGAMAGAIVGGAAFGVWIVRLKLQLRAAREHVRMLLAVARAAAVCVDDATSTARILGERLREDP
jgi:hypothetical protein